MHGNYRFKTEDAERFASENNFKTHRQGNELVFTKCPYCGGNSRSDKNKFAINLITGQFNCFRASCGARGNMITLAQDFNFSLGREIDEYYRPQRQFKRYKRPEAPIEPKEAAVKYLKSRGISEETVRKFQITSKDDVVVFPFFDEKGDIQTIKYRNPDPKDGQSKEWFEKNCKPILFGMLQCNPSNKTLIVTEGQIDSLSVAEAGIENAVSVPGGVNSFTWVPYCWDWISQFEKIVVFGDHEKGHVTLYAEFCQRWQRKVWCVREEDYLDCKDANDILRKHGAEQIRKCIENAEQPPIPKIIDLSEVEDVDINEIDKLRTGLWKLDDVLCGGLPFGQLVLVTGKAGDGKSTLANQILVNAINEGYKVFMYSGELPNYLLKSWMTFQAAGPSNIKKIDQKGEYRTNSGYEIQPEVKKKISDWFADQAWIYDNRIADNEDDEQVKLLDLIDMVVVQKGVRVVLLDNLMTALDLDPGEAQDKYDRQGLFMKRLARLALKHNILIILVAHKRKMSAPEANDTVAGSADIVNLASIVISYERGSKEDDPKSRRLKVTKNRLFGELTSGHGLLLDFDPASKRIYDHENNGELKRHYGWEGFDYAEHFKNDNDEDIKLPWA